MSLKSRINQRVDSLVAAVEIILAISLIVGIALNFLNVIGRYLFSVTIHGSDEVEIYILIFICFLGAATVTWRGLHLRMDVAIEAVSGRFRRWALWLEFVVTGIVAAFAGYYSFLYVKRIHSLGAVSDIARLPTWIPHSSVVLGLALIFIFLMLRIWIGAAGGERR